MSPAATRKRRVTPWSESRQLGVAVVGCLALAAVAIGVPVMVAVYLVVATIGFLWPPPELWPEIPQQRSAVLMRAAGRRLFLPRPADVLFGGTGHEAELGASRFSLTRPSSFAALGVACLVAFGIWFSSLFIPLSQWTVRLVFGLRLWPINTVATYVLLQGYAAANRLKDPAVPAPAALMTRAGVQASARTAIPAAAVSALGGGVFVVMGVRRLGLHVPVASVGAVAFVVTGVAVWIGVVGRASTERWRTLLAAREQWNASWMTALGPRVPPPFFVDEYDLPEDQVPTHKCASFAVPAGGDWRQYLAAVPKLTPVLGTEQLVLTPWQAAGADGERVAGTMSKVGFYLRWPVVPLGERPHLQHIPDGADDRTRDFVISLAFHNAFAALKLDAPVLVAVVSLTDGTTDDYLYETHWRIPGATTPEQIADQTTALADLIGAPWLRVSRSTIASGAAAPLPGDLCSIVFGLPPDQVALRDPVEPIRDHLQRLQWDGWMRACKVFGADGVVPRLLRTEDAKQGLKLATFAIPPGLAVDKVEERLKALRAASGCSYMEIEPADIAQQVRLRYGADDPLERVYLYVDHAARLHPNGPTPGNPIVDWVVGVGPDGELVVDSFDSDNPHLFVAGGSGMGKSVVVSSMILSLCASNTPDDLQLVLIEPKTDLHAFADLAHVRRFVSNQTPATSLYAAAADALEEVNEEMKRRYELFTDPARQNRPNKLSEARHIAQLEGPLPDGSKHPFDLPVIIVVHEEVAETLGTQGVPKADKPDQERVNSLLNTIAGLGRAAGIHLVVATQYPTKDYIGGAMRLKNQCRRIGLGVQDQVASKVIIDRPGLENISTPGRGMAAYKNTYRGFRGLLLRKPSKEDPNVPDDVAEALAALPHHSGGTHLARPSDLAERFAPPAIPDDLYQRSAS
ncbi:MAG TPA: FtsK/SpoIIIE domain-containing protein [Acidimicrobiales bacterium]|nr:FtsK/SpoIIIE domain-containing protein [Acidimicrobiales bacterium]